MYLRYWSRYSEQIRTVIFEEGITRIGKYAFTNYSNLTGNLYIPNTVTSIGQSAFFNCSGLTSLVLSSNLKSIEGSAFYQCIGFSGVLRIPDGIENIGYGAFYGCAGFSGPLRLPNSLTTLGGGEAFHGCSGFNGNLTISNNLTCIRGSTFSGCENLRRKLVIPDNVTNIEANAFNGCENFDGIDLGLGVEVIERWNFYLPYSATPIYIPASVKVIEYDAFDIRNIDDTWRTCEFYFLGDAPDVDNNGGKSFRGHRMNVVLFYLPDKAGWIESDKYDAEAETWNGYKLRVWDGKPDPDLPSPGDSGIVNIFPTNGSTDVDYTVSMEFRITFDREINTHNGGNLADIDWETDNPFSIYRVSDNRLVWKAIEYSGNCFTVAYGDKNTLVVTLTNGDSFFEPNTTYYITMDESSVRFTDGTSSSAIEKGDWRFTTASTSAPGEKYTVSYNLNGGDGLIPAPQDYAPNTKIEIISAIPTRSGYTFSGWDNGENIIYHPGSSFIMLDQDVVLTAVWTPLIPTPMPNPSPVISSTTPASATYNIAISTPANGKVIITPTSAIKGTTMTITITPDSGYELSSLAVTDSKGNDLDIVDKGNGKYTFTMPDSRVTVDATFQPIPVQDISHVPQEPQTPWRNQFTDVTPDEWYYDAVKFASENSLMNGLNDATFAPNDNLTRAQLAQILYNKEGKPAISNTSDFTDVTADRWYAPAITWAAENNIVGGYGDGRFGPDDSITREQLAVMLWRHAGEPASNGNIVFGDVDQISGFAQAAIRWAVKNRILNGKGNNTLDPKGFATRAEVAQMLKNYLE